MFFYPGFKLRSYHYKYLTIFWAFVSIVLINHFVSNIQVLLVLQKEDSIESFEQLLKRDDIKLLVNGGSKTQNFKKSNVSKNH
jgi:hypothetical protein